MIYDINCFFGHWPFCYLRSATLPDLLRVHEKAGVCGGALGFLDSIFYNDPSEGDDLFLKMEIADSYVRTPCIHPKLPCVIDDLERYQPKAVRVYPTMHGYSLTDEVFAPIADYLVRHDIRLLVNARLYTSREAYFFIAPEPDTAAIATFVQKHPSLKIALLSHERSELLELSDMFRCAGNVVADTSFVRAIFYETLAEKIGIEHMVFGSCHPLICLESTRLTIEKSDWSTAEKDAVFCENYLRFMQ